MNHHPNQDGPTSPPELNRLRPYLRPFWDIAERAVADVREREPLAAHPVLEPARHQLVSALIGLQIQNEIAAAFSDVLLPDNDLHALFPVFRVRGTGDALRVGKLNDDGYPASLKSKPRGDVRLPSVGFAKQLRLFSTDGANLHMGWFTDRFGEFDGFGVSRVGSDLELDWTVRAEPHSTRVDDVQLSVRVFRRIA